MGEDLVLVVCATAARVAAKHADLEVALRELLPYLRRDYQAVVEAERRLRVAGANDDASDAAELLRHVLDTGLFYQPGRHGHA